MQPAWVIITDSHVGAVSVGGERPSVSCQYPDWLRRRTWQSLNGQLQFSVDRSGTALYRKRSMTSSVMPETGSRSDSEYRCRRRSEEGTSYEQRHDSTAIQLSAVVLHDWSAAYDAIIITRGPIHKKNL